MPAPETIVTGAATGAAAGIAGLVGVTDPMTYVVITLIGMLFRAFQAQQATSASRDAEHEAHREAVRSERRLSANTLRTIQEANQPLMRWFLNARDASAEPTALEAKVSGVQGSALRERTRLASLDDH